MQGYEIVQSMIALSEKKKLLMEQIYNISIKQRDYIDKADASSLQKTIDDKQKRINDINKLDKEFQSSFTKIKEFYGVDSIEKINSREIPNITDLKKIISAIMELTKTIYETEKENNQRINGYMDRLKTDIKKINVGKNAMSAYKSTKPTSQSVYFDKKK